MPSSGEGPREHCSWKTIVTYSKLISKCDGSSDFSIDSVHFYEEDDFFTELDDNVDAGILRTGCYMIEPYGYEPEFSSDDDGHEEDADIGNGTGSADNHPSRQQNRLV